LSRTVTLYNFPDAGKNMKLNAQDLKEIAALTLDHYNQRAEEFWTGTRDHDVSQNIAAMLQYADG
jgi:hypothetical protein